MWLQPGFSGDRTRRNKLERNRRRLVSLLVAGWALHRIPDTESAQEESWCRVVRPRPYVTCAAATGPRGAPRASLSSPRRVRVYTKCPLPAGFPRPSPRSNLRERKRCTSGRSFYRTDGTFFISPTASTPSTVVFTSPPSIPTSRDSSSTPRSNGQSHEPRPITETPNTKFISPQPFEALSG